MASACQSDVHQGCTPVDQRGAIIPGSALWFMPYLPYPLHPSHYTALSSLVLFSFTPPQAGVFGPRSVTWLPGEGPREGLQGHRWGLSSIYPPPSCLSLHLPWVPTSPTLFYPCPAGQSSHICVPCSPGARGTEESRRIIAEQAGRGPMWTSCPSENLPGSVSPSLPHLITSLIFINSWSFFMPCRPEIDREGGRRRGRGEGGDRLGGRVATPQQQQQQQQPPQTQLNQQGQQLELSCLVTSLRAQGL